MKVVVILLQNAYASERALAETLRRLEEIGMSGIEKDSVGTFGIARGSLAVDSLDSDVIRRIETVPGVLTVRAVRQ